MRRCKGMVFDCQAVCKRQARACPMLASCSQQAISNKQHAESIGAEWQEDPCYNMMRNGQQSLSLYQ